MNSEQVFVAGKDSRTRTVTGVDAPADIGLDAARRRIAIPLFNLNRVEFWTIP